MTTAPAFLRETVRSQILISQSCPDSVILHQSLPSMCSDFSGTKQSLIVLTYLQKCEDAVWINYYLCSTYEQSSLLLLNTCWSHLWTAMFKDRLGLSFPTINCYLNNSDFRYSQVQNLFGTDSMKGVLKLLSTFFHGGRKVKHRTLPVHKNHSSNAPITDLFMLITVLSV